MKNIHNNSLRIKAEIRERTIRYVYDVSGPWREAFNIDGIEGWFASAGNGIHEFFVEYDEPIESVPQSIAVIPFLCNVLPIAWVYDAIIYVDEIDEQFLHSLPHVKQAYIEMYPEFEFGGAVIAASVVGNRLLRPVGRPLVLFSGGVDAVFTMLGNRALSPTLLTIWGADLFFKQEEAWNLVKRQNLELAESFGLGFTSIKSSFRLFLKYAVLDAKCGKPVRDNWWHGFQHGIGLLGLVAPIAWTRRTDQVIISSSYASSDPFFTRCASDPLIDSSLRFFGASCRHYDYTVNRQEKVEFICQEASALSKRVPLRVCWEVQKGQNCCLCDKCLRTLFAIYAENADPADFGFPLTDDMLAAIEAKLRSGGVKPTAYWAAIVGKLQADERRWRQSPHVAALLDLFPARRKAG